MRYENNGIEIEHRECQIIREAAQKFLLDNSSENRLLNEKDWFFFVIRKIGQEKKLKRRYCNQVSRFLEHMEPSYYEAFITYVKYLATSGRGIELMKPFFLGNGKIIMPVNRHERSWL